MADPQTATDALTHGAQWVILAGLSIERMWSRIAKLLGQANGASSSSKEELRSVLDEKLDQRVLPILDKQTTILDSVANTQEGIAVMLDARRRKR